MGFDSPTIGAGLFVIAATIIAVTIAIGVGVTAFASNPGASALMGNSQKMFLNMGNAGFMFMAVALIIFNLLAAFFLPTHPIFVVIDIIFIPFSIWIAAILSNAWASSLSTLAATYGYTIMNFVMNNLVPIILGSDILTAIVSYAIIKNAYG